ncbi:hypothetical protein [Aquimarina muelleri]|uniref:Uncharacterized protein n=1 Tax=Aquimarina muelleri TaxID=279356 RepID=A0A918N2N9_9FLAO|nr:hypothetical protein [Aquimarina muelleri]MCX2763563.1 hypothetical protein [Aquimarina muelleri]GGX14415.1 hypothetical protein GCM10007384_14980 [Aquimarina muelleri]
MKPIKSTISKYKVGDIVFAKVSPRISLVVRRHMDGVYYCGFQNDPDRWELGLSLKALVGG